MRNGEVIDARFRLHIDRLTAERVLPVTLEVVCSAAKKGGPSRTTSRLKQEDRWFVPDLGGWKAMIENVPALRLAAVLGDFNMDVPFEHTSAWRLILVLLRG